MSSQVILYDLPSKQGVAWSLNPWKSKKRTIVSKTEFHAKQVPARMILNYKNIDYKTEWVDYPDLAPYFKSLGIPPNDPKAPGYFTDYSSPAIRYADNSLGMDSWPIAHELEKRYPEPSLHLDDPIVVQIRDHIPKLLTPIVPHLIPKVGRIQTEGSAPYFHETRKKAFGMSLDDFEKQAGTEKCWEDAKAPAKEAGDLLRKNGGPFFLGKTVSYADFIFVSMIQMIKQIDQGTGVYERFMGLDEAFPKVYEASQQWLKKET